MIGMYYGVARRSSPCYVIATFYSKDEAEVWIKNHVGDFVVVEY